MSGELGFGATKILSNVIIVQCKIRSLDSEAKNKNECVITKVESNLRLSSHISNHFNLVSYTPKISMY